MILLVHRQGGRCVSADGAGQGAMDRTGVGRLGVRRRAVGQAVPATPDTDGRGDRPAATAGLRRLSCH